MGNRTRPERENLVKYALIMRKIVFVAAVFAMFSALAQSEEFEEGDYFELDRWSFGVASALELPQGGAHFNRKAGLAIRCGYAIDDFWNLEAMGEWCENRYALSAGALWLWWGYERLDPFFTFGLKDWIKTDWGAYLGIGTFWHIDDHWSLRADITPMLGVEDGCNMIYSFTLGIQRSW